MTRRVLAVVRARRRSAGVGLVTAIFLLVVLAALGVAMVTIFISQRAASSLDEQGARAYQAARAGIEWGLFQQLRRNSCQPSASFPLPASSSLSGFVVTVTCTPAGNAPLTRWIIRATACNLQPPGGTCQNPSNNPDFVQRVLEVEV